MSEDVTEQNETPEIEEELQEPVAAEEEAPAIEPEVDPSAPPPWQASYDYNYGGKTHEIPEMYRSIIKDQESLTQVRQLFEKVNGFEEYKPMIADFRKKLSEYEPTISKLAEAAQFLGDKQYDDFIERMGLSPDQIKDLAIHIINREKMSPEQKAVMEEKRRYQLENSKLQSENKSYQERLHHEMVTATDYQIDRELEKPEVSQMVAKYEARQGAGAFKQLVLQTGSAMFTQTGNNPTPDQVVSQIRKMFGPFLSDSAETIVAAKKVLKTIPNVGGGSSAPANSRVSSLDDIRKLREKANQLD
jgi:hypothetical protein